MIGENQNEGLIEIVADLKDQIMELKSVAANQDEAISQLHNSGSEDRWTPCSNSEEVNWYVRRYAQLH